MPLEIAIKAIFFQSCGLQLRNLQSRDTGGGVKGRPFYAHYTTLLNRKIAGIALCGYFRMFGSSSPL